MPVVEKVEGEPFAVAREHAPRLGGVAFAEEENVVAARSARPARAGRSGSAAAAAPRARASCRARPPRGRRPAGQPAACRGRAGASRAAPAAASRRPRRPARPRTCARRRSGRGALEPGSNPSEGPNSGSSATRTPVSRASSSALLGSRPSRSFESSPMPSAASPPPTRSPETSATPTPPPRASRRGSARRARARAGRRSAARGRGAADPRRSCRGETVRRTRPSRSCAAAERIDELAVGEPPRHRVDREVAPRRSSSTVASGSTTISKSWRPGPVETSRRGGANSIPAGASARIARSRG